jgi:hypothetical protein
MRLVGMADLDRQLPQQEPVHQREAVPPALGLVQLVDQPPAVGAEHLNQGHGLAAELGHGQPPT